MRRGAARRARVSGYPDTPMRVGRRQEAAGRPRAQPARDDTDLVSSSTLTSPPTGARQRGWLFSLRYVVPAAVCLAGVVVLLVAGVGGYGPDALAALFGAGGAIYLMNKFMRMWISGDGERDVEEAGRLFLDRYGVWPDEAPADWRSPDGGDDAGTVVRRLAQQRQDSDVAA